MKLLFTLFCTMLFMTSTLLGQEVPEWENPEIFAVNQEKTRSTAIPYAGEQVALQDNYGESRYFQ